MAITQLLFKKGNYLGNIELDVVISEGANASARLTKNPVENGADFNDHIIIEPMSFTMTGVVSNASSNIIQAAQNTFSQVGGQTKSALAWEDMLQLMAFKTPFNLHQGLKTYENVVLTSLAETQDKDTSNALYFTASLSEVVLVGTGAPPVTTFEDQDTEDSMVPATSGGLKPI